MRLRKRNADIDRFDVVVCGRDVGIRVVPFARRKISRVHRAREIAPGLRRQRLREPPRVRVLLDAFPQRDRRRGGFVQNPPRVFFGQERHTFVRHGVDDQFPPQRRRRARARLDGAPPPTNKRDGVLRLEAHVHARDVFRHLTVAVEPHVVPVVAVRLRHAPAFERPGQPRERAGFRARHGVRRDAAPKRAERSFVQPHRFRVARLERLIVEQRKRQVRDAGRRLCGSRRRLAAQRVQSREIGSVPPLGALHRDFARHVAGPRRQRGLNLGLERRGNAH